MIRRNPITGEPVIFAAHRAERPNNFRDDGRCPFCPGNEAMTPPEIARAGDPWHLRVFPNKYPATKHHEVVVETSRHEATFDALSAAEADDAVRTYIERYAALAELPDVRAICIFKNHGASAGASIPHIHSQIIATPFVPPRVERERDAFARAERCPLCAPVGEVIASTDSFAWLAPHASALPYEQWIVPRRHDNEPTAIESTSELASLLQRASAAMLDTGNAFNWIFLTFPGEPRAHWYVQLFARHAVWAGFELGTGSAIETVDPLAVAERFRQRRQ